VVEALQDLAKSTLADLLYDLEAESDLVILGNAVVAVTIIVPIIYYPLSFGRVYLEFIGG
jgi:hypothetical protein